MTAPTFRQVCQHTGEVAESSIAAEHDVLREATVRVQELEAAAAAVRALHRSCRYVACDTGPFCEVCETAWPCPTITALDGAK
jgi:hypothetical protein